MLDQAEKVRAEVARSWLGGTLEEGREFTMIHVEFSQGVDEGLTWLCGPNRPVGGHHRIWLTTTPDRAVGSTLRHEVTHVVLNAMFPQGMPAWTNEGVASLYDDEGRVADRAKIMRRIERSGRWPALRRLLDQPRIRPTDEVAYALSTSLTRYLVSVGGRPRLLQFAARSSSVGWDRAVKEYYGFADVDDLQKRWQAWVSQAERSSRPRGNNR